MENGENINKNEEPEIDFKMEEFEYSPEAKVLREKLKSLNRKDANLMSNKIALFGQELKEKHGEDELHKYEAYRLLAGSGDRKKPENFDLPGEDSIERFMDSLEEEINP
ncbi:MAG: hypothetical protein NUV64_03410 [Parcubacteria group bacterium]|nr:hypothetical protein [Parcubacteria group bacterium]MCR4342372.1 hypothetical protein [Patescibacteria group bacterium]